MSCACARHLRVRPSCSATESSFRAAASATFTGLNALKPDRIAEANKNARLSAEQFARDSGADGEECDDCGSSGGSSSFQKVRVVTTIDYDLNWGWSGVTSAAWDPSHLE